MIIKRNHIKGILGGLAILAWVAFVSCSPGEIIRAARVVASGDGGSAGRLAAEKAVEYVSHPDKISEDLRRIQAAIDLFRKLAGDRWGKDDVREPTPYEYVKYTQNYLSRAVVDFNTGIIAVETVDQEKPLVSLKNAIVTTVLTPHDPRAVDLYSDSEVVLGGEPFLLGLVKDFDGRDIRWPWRAERFADRLIERNLRQRPSLSEDGDRTVYFVTIEMVADHQDVRAAKYRPLVEKYSREFGQSRTLVYAVIKTESNFNPYAVSRSQALGLMQVMPSTAGRDVYRMLNGRDGIPSRDYLLDPTNNVKYGTAYLHILCNRYLDGIENELSREYCTIAAYNAGAGEVLRTFDSDKNRATAVINSMPPLEVYNRLKNDIAKEEARQYIVKVINAKRDFVNF